MIDKFIPKTTKQLTFSAMIIAIYIVVMYFTQGISFGAIQCRVATAIYALAYPFPFLVIPLGVANCLSNIMGGMFIDMIGGLFVGWITSFFIVILRFISDKNEAKTINFICKILVILPITIIPAFGVSIWLAPILSTQETTVTYIGLSLSLCAGQFIAGAIGSFLLFFLEKFLKSFSKFLS